MKNRDGRTITLPISSAAAAPNHPNRFVCLYGCVYIHICIVAVSDGRLLFAIIILLVVLEFFWMVMCLLC